MIFRTGMDKFLPERVHFPRNQPNHEDHFQKQPTKSIMVLDYRHFWTARISTPRGSIPRSGRNYAVAETTRAGNVHTSSTGNRATRGRYTCSFQKQEAPLSLSPISKPKKPLVSEGLLLSKKIFVLLSSNRNA
jgi:hypothetical protein